MEYNPLPPMMPILCFDMGVIMTLAGAAPPAFSPLASATKSASLSPWNYLIEY
jgi:hypothetical protein